MNQSLDAPPVFLAPDDPAKRAQWRAELKAWRERARQELSYKGETYDDPAFKWMQTCRACGKVMLFDREFVDPHTGTFHVEEWVANFKQQFGDLDALLLWQAYPRIGIDSRNQFDHYRQIPGGIKALTNIIERLHALGVKAILAYNPWDVGTRREPKPDHEVMAELVSQAGFDGIFLDTLSQAGNQLRSSLDHARPGVALISELALPVGAIKDHHASWGQWFDDSEAPGVIRNRWFERRHMLHLIRRWDIDHSSELQMAWMNGAGMLLWQNIFGSWNGWTDRDLSILRSMLPIQKHFNEVLTAGEWTPLVECPLKDVYATKWQLRGATLWTLVNRSESEVHGTGLPESSHSGARMFDLLRGIEIDHAEVSIHPRGIGAIARLADHLIDKPFQDLLEQQARRYAEGQPPATRVDVLPVRHAIPQGALDKAQVSRMRVRECGDYIPMQQILTPGLHQVRSVQRWAPASDIVVEPKEITNRQFYEFIKATDYQPQQSENFLLHWENNSPKAEDLDKAVVHVDLADARAYCEWAKKRLPTEDEWQAAAPNATVWNWTESEHFDGHTAFSFLKGGPPTRVQGSDWYADGGPNPADWSAKLIHFYPSIDRSKTIGFRCVTLVSPQ